jgi:hypothetical protein
MGSPPVSVDSGQLTIIIVDVSEKGNKKAPPVTMAKKHIRFHTPSGN